MGSIITFSLFILGILVSSSLPGAKAKSCPRDWFEHQGNCYAYFNTLQSWAEAEIECQIHGPGTHLASILSSAETALVAKYISTHQTNPRNVWIGLHDVRQNRKWKWTDGSTYNYQNWAPGEPNNSGKKEFCVELTKSTDFKKWNDAPCDKRNAYICEQQL